jgi:phosphoglycolate phosphatase
MGKAADRLRFRTATLTDWRRVWNAYREEWEGGVLNVEPAAGAEIVGVLVSGIPRATIDDLDEQEATHLPRERVSVRKVSGETVEAEMYVLRDAAFSGKPSLKYLEVVLRRARQADRRVFQSVLTGCVDDRGEPLRFDAEVAVEAKHASRSTGRDLRIRGLIYDHDGTLVDSIALVVEATNAALRSAGFAGAEREDIVRGMVLPTLERLGRHAGGTERSLEADLAKRFYEKAWQIGAAAAHPYEGVRDLLRALHSRGLRQGMLSNNQGHFIRRIMTAHGLDEWLEPILGEEDVPAPKPSAQGFMKIARQWELEPAEILLVGDSAADAGTAHAAGCPSVGVSWGTHPRDELETAGFGRIIDQPEELLELLEELGA